MRDYFTLCKPRVVLLMLLTAWAGMYLGTTHPLPLTCWVNATLGIALLSGAAATLNHIIDHRIDALMDRTKYRPLASGRLTLKKASLFAITQALIGFCILAIFVNPLTAFLTLATAIGYSIIYSIYLKRTTSQNIVIGGLSGAMPPLLGWTAATNQISLHAALLVLIIFAWTPAHFWSLCLNRLQEYQKTPIPMLPITHGVPFTKLNIVIYSLLTVISSLLPYALHMSGLFYLTVALLLGTCFVFYTLKLQAAADYHRIALSTFRFSIFYLTGIFLALLIDHSL